MRLRLSVLGVWSLRDDDGFRLASLQPKRFALLTYLALEARRRPVRRDRVLGVFWPEQRDKQARGALSQALHYLRARLGPAVVCVRGSEELWLNRAAIACDAVELLDAADAEEWSAVAGLYDGVFLPEFFSRRAPALDHWVSTTRHDLRGVATTAAEALADEAEAAGETLRAVRWARQACEWSEGDEAETRNLMRRCDRTGDRTGVLEAFAALQAALHSLEAEPAPETVELLAAMRARWSAEAPEARPPGLGASLDVAPAAGRREAEVRAPAPVAPTRDAVAERTPPLRGLGRRRAAVLGSLVTAALFGFLVLSFRTLARPRVPGTQRRPTLLVQSLPASVPGATLSELNGEIAARLGGASGMNVVLAGMSPAVRPVVGTYDLRDGVLRAPGGYVISARLVDAASGKLLASYRRREMAATPRVALGVGALDVARFASRAVGRVRLREAIRRGPAPRRAIDLVLLGVGDREHADSLFDAGAAAAAARFYAMADSMLARAASLAPGWVEPPLERAKTFAASVWPAIGAPPDSPTRQRAMAESRSGVEQANAVLRLRPGDLDALEARARLERWEWLLGPPEPKARIRRILRRAEADSRTVLAAAPDRAGAWVVLGTALVARGDFPGAYWAFTRARAADTYDEYGDDIAMNLFDAAGETGDTAAARHWCDAVRRRMPRDWVAADSALEMLAGVPRPDSLRIPESLAGVDPATVGPVPMAELSALRALVLARAGALRHGRTLLDSIAGRRHAAGGIDQYLARGWLEVGDTARAVAAVRRSLETTTALPEGLLRRRRFAALRRDSSLFSDRFASRFTSH